ncbi:MAG: hypothetical protein KDA66_03695 [Planctomycetaceae bacterium]|nr:hypothetical protein [Planctomycetaceae bacterium]
MFRSVLVVAVFVFGGILPAEEYPSWPIVFEDNFEDGMSHWTSSDPNAWRMAGEKENQQLDQFQQSKVKTPVRSPFNRALANDVVVGSFQLDVDFKSTARDYPHRSLCLFFGFQDPAHLYYVHFGQRTDDHANQVFIVNNEPRTKISTETTPGTPWDNEWHHARIVRNVENGEIAVYFDDMEKPIMKAVDKTFSWGQIGVGSFDDTGLFDNVQLRGVVVKPEK